MTDELAYKLKALLEDNNKKHLEQHIRAYNTGTQYKKEFNEGIRLMLLAQGVDLASGDYIVYDD